MNGNSSPCFGVQCQQHKRLRRKLVVHRAAIALRRTFPFLKRLEFDGMALPTAIADSSLVDCSLTSSAKAESLGHAVGQGDEIRSIVGQQEDLQGHEAAITDVIFAPDGRNVASASTDGVVRPSAFSGIGSWFLILLQRSVQHWGFAG